MNPFSRRLLIAMTAGALVACSATPIPPPATSPRGAASLTASPTVPPSSRPVASLNSEVALGGYRWTRINAQQFSGVALESITITADGRLLGLGDSLTAQAPDGPPPQPTIWSSTDGLAWTRNPNSAAFASQRAFWVESVRALVRTASGFVAVGTESQDDASLADAAAWFSPDDVTWTRAIVNDGIGRTMDEVVATADGLVALGDTDYSFHGGFGGGTAIWTSPDGRTWARVPDDVGPPHGTRLRRIVRWPAGFLATATFEWGEGSPDAARPPLTAGIWTSKDGIHWAPIPGSPLGLNGLIRTGHGYMAVGTGSGHPAEAVIWRSADGLTWTRAILPRPADLPAGASAYTDAVASSPTGFVAFGTRDDTFAEIGWSSPDGVTWVAFNLDPVLAGAIVDDLLPIRDQLLLSGHFDQPDGTREPVVWLLRP
jgi:hypothetical protein